jgi:hypothetical protein
MDRLPRVYPVHGEIFFAGKPAIGAVIAFHPVNKPEGPVSTSRGIADPQGKFSLTTFVSSDGVPEGEYIVTVYWPVRPLNPNGEGNELPADKIGGRFATAARSNLRARITQKPMTLSRVDLAEQTVTQAREFYFAPQGQ